jgi:hypothetical protein
MKKVWNVYQREDGMRVAISPSSQRDTELTDEPGYTFLGQVTEEIEELKKEPKKEVEKVVEVRKIADISDVKDIKNLDYWQVVVPCQAIPEDVYDITVHYKIKE